MRPDEAQDRELAERFAKHRDDSAFRDLYRRHTPLLYRIVRRMVADPERAAEVMQELWVRAAEKLPVFRWESRLSTWLAGIAINCSREELRRGKTVQALEAEATEHPGTRPRLAERVDLERAIEQLPEGYREVVLLHDVEGYTHEEIAQALGIAPETSRSQLTRARAALRAWLERRKEPHDSRA